MLKKPLFWIIVVIVIVILWFVFTGRGNENTGMTGVDVGAPTATSPAISPAAGPASAPATQNNATGSQSAPAPTQ